MNDEIIEIQRRMNAITNIQLETYRFPLTKKLTWRKRLQRLVLEWALRSPEGSRRERVLLLLYIRLLHWNNPIKAEA
jgi:hypothetical protein